MKAALEIKEGEDRGENESTEVVLRRNTKKLLSLVIGGFPLEHRRTDREVVYQCTGLRRKEVRDESTEEQFLRKGLEGVTI